MQKQIITILPHAFCKKLHGQGIHRLICMALNIALTQNVNYYAPGTIIHSFTGLYTEPFQL